MRRKWSALGVVLFLGLLPAASLAQPPEVSEFGSRYDGFRLVFEQHKLKLVDQNVLVPANDRSGFIIVVLGDPAPLQSLARQGVRWRELVEGGSSLLVATDRRTPLLLKNFDILVAQGPVTVTQDDESYRGRPYCPVISNFRTDSPLFTGVEKLVLNSPGYLAGVHPASRRATAWLPASAVAPAHRKVGSQPIVFASNVRRGRLLVIADQSLFVNEMFLEPNARGNSRFAGNAVEWLIHDRDPSRLKVVFFEDSIPAGEWVDRRFLSGEWPAEPVVDLATLLSVGNAVIESVEKEHQETNLFNELLTRGQSRFPPGAMQQAGLVLPACIIALLLLWWLVQSQPGNLDVERKSPPTARPLSLLELRRHEVLARGQFAEPARHLAREFYTNAFDDADFSGSEPKFLMTAGLWTRWRAKKWMRLLWRLATRRSGGKWTQQRFFRLQRAIAWLESYRASGSLSLHRAESYPTGTTTREYDGTVKHRSDST